MAGCCSREQCCFKFRNQAFMSENGMAPSDTGTLLPIRQSVEKAFSGATDPNEHSEKQPDEHVFEFP